jgi:glycine/D-amino acid oxidase-like deaminating enzyme
MSFSRVAVIGGGIVGTAAATFLAEAGVDVTLYEGEALGAGASGRNSGVVQLPFDPALGPLYEATVHEYRDLATAVPAAGFRLPDRTSGVLLVSQDADLVRRLAGELGETSPSMRPEVLVGDDLLAADPALAPDLAACRLDVGYPVVPSAPTYAFASYAERRGARIRVGRHVRPRVERGRATGVEVDGRVEPADAVLVAAGPWTPEVIDPSGAWCPIVPRWGVVVETLLADPPRHVIEEAEMDEVVGPPGLIEDATDQEAPASSVVTAGGVSVVGSTFLPTEPVPADWTERLLERCLRFVPGLMTAPIRETRACARPVSLDGRPLLGAVEGVEGLFVCAGHGPWGISTGPGSARLVVDLMLGRDGALPPELDAARFGAPPLG